MIAYPSVIEMIGHTPLVRLKRVSEVTGWTVYGKWEGKNPGGSVKDRLAWAMIDDAIKAGRLAPGGTIVEPTSGNTGIGLAMIAAAMGFRCILTMPETASVERRALMAGYGAEVVLTAAKDGMAGAIREAESILRQVSGAVMLQQFENPANPRIHYQTTGPEIWSALGGEVDAVVAGVGTGGTISGVGRFLKEQRARIRIVAVEPAESAVLSGGPPGPHRIQGIGAGFVPRVLDQSVIDQVVPVSDRWALAEARQLMKTEGIAVGISSGAAVKAAEIALPTIAARGVAVVILPDLAERYLSTALFTEEDEA
jgi:cysteine synthase A